MAHLSDDSIYSLTFENRALGTEESVHFATCAECQARASASVDLARTLHVARLSEPNVEQRARLYALASEVQTSGLAQRITSWVRAILAMDTRVQSAASGIRGMETTYRLLYSTQSLDVELMVDPTNGARTIQGALLPIAQHEEGGATLVQLTGGSNARIETESTPDGRFQFLDVSPGRYDMWIVRTDPAEEVMLVALEIS